MGFRRSLALWLCPELAQDRQIVVVTANGQGGPAEHLIRLCDLYAEYNDITHWRVSMLVRGDGGFFDRLKKGASCTVRTERKVVQWFSDHWPWDLEWPENVVRPAPTKKGYC
ncbi:MAG: hypothetical protein ACWA40_07445 [Planktomarina sp.]